MSVSLPPGEAVDVELDLGSLMPFEHGFVTTWVGRRKTPSGHRLVRGHRVIGWLAASEAGLIGGAEGQAALLSLEADAEHVRHVAESWTLGELADVLMLMPSVVLHAVDLEGLPSGPGPARRLLSRSASVIMAALNEDPEVLGAVLVDQGLLVDHTGHVPGDTDELAGLVADTMRTRQTIAGGLGLPEEGHWTLATPQGSVLLASAADLALGVWTASGSDHRRLLQRMANAVSGSTGDDGQAGHLPEGFVLREGKSGPDAVLSMLRVAREEQVYGHLSVGAGERTTAVVLLSGRPVGLVSSSAATLEEAVYDLTDRRRVARLHQLPLDAAIGEGTANVPGFTLAAFGASIASSRSRTEDRKDTLMARYEDILGFDVGLESLGPKVAHLGAAAEGVDHLSTGDSPRLVIDAGYRQRLEDAEHRMDGLQQEAAALQARLEQAENARMRAEVALREAKDATGEGQNRLRATGADLDQAKLAVAEAERRAEAAEARAERLVRRTSELEHQLERRAAELARTVADSGSREALASTLAGMAEEEARVKAELQTSAERLTEVKRRLVEDERHLRLLEEQTSAAHERQANAVRDLAVTEDGVRAGKAELAAVEAEVRAARRRADDERERRREDEVRRSHLESEIRGLLEERRTVLRELGDLGVQRGQSEAQVAHLADQADALATAHEAALADIEEARRLRARLTDEPLAQALLEDGASMAALGPVLERLEHTRAQGYSVVLLDKAVERALQVIGTVVDRAAETPRHLLSNDVMLLLEQQVPETAGIVRGLTRWSVQQRLEHSLKQAVTDVVLDLEHLLEDQDRAITMLRRTRNVLEQLARLGAPQDEIDALMSRCRYPEALPDIAAATQRLIRVALDDIHLEADQRDAGASVALALTAEALEELLSQLEAAGLVGGRPAGHLWAFMASGLLPSEAGHAPSAAPEEDVLPLEEAPPEEPAPEEAEATEGPLPPAPAPSRSLPPLDDAEERMRLEAELAALDAVRAPHGQGREHVEERLDAGMAALAALEARLGDLEL